MQQSPNFGSGPGGRPFQLNSFLVGIDNVVATFNLGVLASGGAIDTGAKPILFPNLPVAQSPSVQNNQMVPTAQQSVAFTPPSDSALFLYTTITLLTQPLQTGLVVAYTSVNPYAKDATGIVYTPQGPQLQVLTTYTQFGATWRASFYNSGATGSAGPKLFTFLIAAQLVLTFPIGTGV